MKKTLKSLLALAMAVLMVLSLAACGGSEEGEKTKEEQQNNPEFTYSAKYTEFDAEHEKYGYLSTISMNNDGIFLTGEEEIKKDGAESEETADANGTEPAADAESADEENHVTYEPRLLFADYDGNIEVLPGYKPPETDDDNAYFGIGSIFAAEDGNIRTIEYINKYEYTGPDNITKNDDEYWMYMQDKSEYYIRTLDKTGAELSSAQIELPEDSYLDSRNILIDKAGNLILGVGDGIIGFKDDGTKLFELSNDEYIERMLLLADGRIVVSSWGNNGPAVFELNTETGKLGEPIDLPRNAYNIYSGGDKYDLCYIDGTRLYGFNIGEEPVKILNWIDVDICGDRIEGFNINADGSIVGISMIPPVKENDSYKTEIFKLTPQPYDPSAQKQELSIAVMWPEQQLVDSIVKHNRSNPDYRIVLKDYSEFNTEDDYGAGRTKLLTEMLSGEMPDMVSVSSLPYTQLASKGIIEDIYPFLDADKDLSRDDLFENVIKAMEVDGKLCQIFPSFSIITAAGSAKVVGDMESWNYKQFNEALASMPEGCTAFGPGVTKSAMLSGCLSMDINMYADWSTGECHFDSPEFIELLEFANQFPKEFDYTTYEPAPGEDTMSLIASGKQMLMDVYISDMESIAMDDLQFGGDAVYIGYPSNNGGGSMLSINNGYAITKNCKDKQAAWDFLKVFFTEKYEDNMYYSLPLNKASFDKKLKEAMTPVYETDENGNYVLDENGDKIEVSNHGVSFGNGTSYDLYAMTEAQAAKLKNLIESTTKVSDSNSTLTEIVVEEAVPYFEGQKSAEETAKLIQSKVNIYINEQR